MQGGRKGGQKKHPTYIGLFAADPKTANKTVKSVCKEALIDVMKHISPQAYLSEGQTIEKIQKIYGHERDPTQQEVLLVERDLLQFEEFKSPQDNYHITCLYIGNKIEKLNKKQQNLYKCWKDGIKQSIKVDFIVYVPNCIMAGYTGDIGDVESDNQFPHMTLLLKGGTTAVESNFVLEMLNKHEDEIFKQKQKKIICLNIPYKDSKMMYIINKPFELDAICGNNFSLGKA